MMLVLILLISSALALNEPGSVWRKSCEIIGDALGPAQEVYPCLDEYKSETKKAERDNRFELVTRTAKPLLNNKYSYEAIVEGNSCMTEKTKVKCRPTLDTLTRYAGLTCKSVNPCTLSKSSSTTVTMSSHDSSGQSITVGQIGFNKQGGSDASVSRTIDEAISLTIAPNETVIVYTFAMMKRCAFQCQGVDQEVLTWQGDRQGNQIFIYYTMVHNEDEDVAIREPSIFVDQSDPSILDFFDCPENQKRQCRAAINPCMAAAFAIKPGPLCQQNLNKCTATCNRCRTTCQGCTLRCSNCVDVCKQE